MEYRTDAGRGIGKDGVVSPLFRKQCEPKLMNHHEGPLVSVITATLDPGTRLARCLDSVAHQSYPAIEHLIIDGGSTDGTVDLLRSRRDVRWISEPDSGQSEALNKGFRLARGRLLTWLNADEVMLPGAVELAVHLATDNPPINWIYADFCVTEPSREWIRETPRRVTKTTFDLGNSIGPGTFFSAEALERAGYLDETFHLTMDLDLWLRFVDLGIAGMRAPRPLVRFEVHPASKTGKIPEDDFMIEEARALAKSGRAIAASVQLGRAAATWLARTQSAPSTAMLGEALAHYRATEMPAAVLPRAMQAGAVAELARRRRTLAGLLALWRPVVWSFRPSAKLAALAVKQTALHRVGRSHL